MQMNWIISSLTLIFLIFSNARKVSTVSGNMRNAIDFPKSTDYCSIGELISDSFDCYSDSWSDRLLRKLSSAQFAAQYSNMAREAYQIPEILQYRYFQLVYRSSDENRDGNERVLGFAEVGLANQIPTLGCIAVSQDARRRGIARSLLAACEMEVRDVWGKSHMEVAVTPDNIAAKHLYISEGYNIKPGEKENLVLPVRERMQNQLKVHILLSKEL